MHLNIDSFSSQGMPTWTLGKPSQFRKFSIVALRHLYVS